MSYSDVEYTRADGEPLVFDAYVPDTPGPHPAAIIVHGGAWVTGDKGRSVQPLFAPLQEAGYAWFSINYRLARGRDLATLISPAGIAALTGAIDDVRAAVAHVRGNSAEFNVDPERIFLIGESAGAQLAEMAALMPGPDGEVKAVVSFYSPSDLEALVKTSPRIPDALRQAVKGTVIEAFLLSGLHQLSSRYVIHPDAPPFLLVHGTSDDLVPYQQSVDMCAALNQAMVPCELFTVEGAGHGIRWWESRPELLSYKSRLIEWLNSTVR